jgi:hypothetical protein
LAVEGLRRVYNDAEVMLDERVGCGDESLSSVEYRGLEYLDALLDWYDSTHRSK